MGAITVLELTQKQMGRPPKPISEHHSFGRWLRSAREARGLTQEELADAVNTKAGVISNLEMGRRDPRRDVVRSLAMVLAADDADDHTRRALLNAGLLAAGFAPVADDGEGTPELERLNVEERRVVAYYRNMPPSLRTIAEMQMQVLSEAQQNAVDQDEVDMENEREHLRNKRGRDTV